MGRRPLPSCVVTRYRPVTLAGRRLLVLGLGRRGGGEGVVRHLRSRGAIVRVVDQADPALLADVVARLHNVGPVEYVLGEPHHTCDVDWADIVVRNPAVPREDPALRHARATAKPVHTETTLFFSEFPGRIHAVTGSKGKTSTCFFLHHLLGGSEADVRLVGNMGGSALAELDGASADTRAVYEVSSFQVEVLGEQGLTAPIAYLTGLHPDHLDRYDSAADYYASKAPLFHLQQPVDWRIAPPRLTLPESFAWDAPSRWSSTGADEPDADATTFVSGDSIWVRPPSRGGGLAVKLIDLDDLGLVGGHRLGNVLAAVGGALVDGVPLAVVRERLRTLPSVPHRMEVIPTDDGRQWINDTAATNPSSAAAGIAALAATTLTVICGGSDKGLDATPLVDGLAAARPEVVLLAGSATDAIAAALDHAGVSRSQIFANMVDAVAHVAGTAVMGATILLSPGCSSFGMFRDEFHRGGIFAAEVLRATGTPVNDELATTLALPRRPSIAQLLPRRSGGSTA